MNNIVIRNLEPQQITINGGGEVIGITTVLVNGIDVTEGSVAYVVVPTKTSELINDSGFLTQETDPTIPYYIKQITQADINRWNNKQEQLVSGVNIKTINENSLLGSGNIDISTTYTAGYGININASNEISNTITSYNDLTDLPTIPTSTSELINDSDFVTSNELSDVAFSGSYADLSNIPEIPDSTSELINDSGFIDINLLWSLFPKSTGSGANINLTDTVKNTPLYLTLGATELSQDGTPTPDIPQDIHTISGDNTISVIGKNYFHISSATPVSNSTCNIISDNAISITNLNNQNYRYATIPIEVEANTTYYFKANVSNSNSSVTDVWFSVWNENKTATLLDTSYTSGTTKNFNTGSYTTLLVGIYATGGGGLSNTATWSEIQLTKANNDTYTPYVSQEANIDLGDIEYCKIGNYEDKFIRSNDGTWQLEKNIGKVVLDGTETITRDGTNTSGEYRFFVSGPSDMITTTSTSLNGYLKSNKFIEITNTNSRSGINGILLRANNTPTFVIFYTETKSYTVENFTTWLTNNNIMVYYPLATPTYTQITGTLAEQLETIYKELTPESEQTNISQTNEDLPFTISATTLKSLSSL